MSEKQNTPKDLRAEDAILGAILLSEAATSEVVSFLTPEDFYRPSNQLIFKAVQDLFAEGTPVDVITVANKLEPDGGLDDIGGAVRLIDLQSNCPSINNASSYARIIKDKATLRRLATMTDNISGRALNEAEASADLLAAAESELFKLANDSGQSTVTSPQSLLLEGLERIEAVSSRDGSMIGVPSGYVGLDRILTGFQDNAFYLLGARPSMGKSVAAVNIAANVALREKKPVLFFSLEMGREELMQRVICSEGLIDANRYKTGNLTKEDWASLAGVMSQLSDSNLWIDDNPSVTLMDIRSSAKRMQGIVGKLGIIIIDYLQLMNAPGAESRHQGISEISRGLKILSRELETPVLALSQLSRGLESRLDKRPMLSDLRESGSLEQDSDVVMFIYRDQVYNEESEDRGIAELIVAKHRNGPNGTVRLGFMEEHTKFVNLASL